MTFFEVDISKTESGQVMTLSVDRGYRAVYGAYPEDLFEGRTVRARSEHCLFGGRFKSYSKPKS